MQLTEAAKIQKKKMTGRINFLSRNFVFIKLICLFYRPEANMQSRRR